MPIADTSGLREYVTEEVLAAKLKISKRSLATYRARRLIPFLKIGKLIRFNPCDVEVALAELTVKTAQRSIGA